MKEIKYRQKYVRQLAEGGTGTDVSFMRFNFPFGLELFARYMLATCSVFYRTSTGQVPNIYRT